MNIFRKPFPMTDEQIIREALKTVTEYADYHPGDSFQVYDCIEKTVNSVKTILRRARGYAPHQALKREDLEEINDIFNRIEAQLRERAEAKANDCLKKRKIREIDIAAAEVLLSAELRKNGLQFFFRWQKLRVRVTVRLEGDRAMTFAVKYKEIREGKLGEIMERVMKAVEAVNSAPEILDSWTLYGAARTNLVWLS